MFKNYPKIKEIMTFLFPTFGNKATQKSRLNFTNVGHLQNCQYVYNTTFGLHIVLLQIHVCIQLQEEASKCSICFFRRRFSDMTKLRKILCVNKNRISAILIKCLFEKNSFLKNGEKWWMLLRQTWSPLFLEWKKAGFLFSSSVIFFFWLSHFWNNPYKLWSFALVRKSWH